MKILLLLISLSLLVACGETSQVEVIQGTQLEIEEEKNLTEKTNISHFKVVEQDPSSSHKRYTPNFVKRTKPNQTYKHIYNIARTYSPYFSIVMIIDIATERTSPTAQSLTLFEHGQMKYKFAISSARAGKTTPIGYMLPQALYNDYTSGAYGVGMPYAIHLGGHYFIHGVNGSSMIKQLGRRAPAGCIRMHNKDAVRINKSILNMSTHSGDYKHRLINVSYSSKIRKGANKGKSIYLNRTKYRFYDHQGCSSCKSYVPFTPANKVSSKGNILFVNDNFQKISLDPLSQISSIIKTGVSNSEMRETNRGFDVLVVIKNFRKLDSAELIELDQDILAQVSTYNVKD